MMVSVQAPKKCTKCHKSNLRQDEDTLDTWFSSGLWTFSTLGWPKQTEDLKRFHPTSVMETGYDILFFWVARMILMTTYALNEIPFKTVYLHGLVRTKTGEKMSKSKPETCIDPLDMIQKYGADALRLSLVIGSSPGNDIRLYEEKIAGYRNFVNKIWNSARFVLMNIEEKDYNANEKDVLNSELSKTDKWILTRLNEVIEDTTKKLEKYALSDAGTEIYDFLWGEFCDWYLEMSKVNKNPKVLSFVLKKILVLLHPFTPFVTEVVWENLNQKNLLINEPWPKKNKDMLFKKEKSEIKIVKDIITNIRALRVESNVDVTRKIKAVIYAGKHEGLMKKKSTIISRMANLGELEILKSGSKLKNALMSVVEDVEIFLPLEGLMDIDKERKRMQKEITEMKNNIDFIEKKLANDGFVNKAPKEVVAKERARREDLIARLEKLRKQLESL